MAAGLHVAMDYELTDKKLKLLLRLNRRSGRQTTNEDLARYLTASVSTVAVYLDEFEVAGIIKRKTGRPVYSDGRYSRYRTITVTREGFALMIREVEKRRSAASNAQTTSLPSSSSG